MARRTTIRVYGPDKHGERYRLTIYTTGGGKSYKSFETEADAEKYKREFLRQLEGEVSLGELFDRYQAHLKQKGNKPVSITTTMFRLRRFFKDGAMLLSSLTPKKAGELYSGLSSQQATDTHRNSLAEAKTFCRWLVKQKLLKVSPLEEVDGVGKRHHGKDQLRIDEARRWLAVALELAEQEEDGAVGAMVTLLLGLRCIEVVSRQVRDLDDGGQLLWVPESKTEAGKRTQVVPEVLQPHLLRLAADKAPTALLFGVHDRAWPRSWVKRICRLAKVPVVTAHGMRGLFATLGMAAHEVPRAVAASLGHASESTTLRSYAKPEALRSAQQKRALDTLTGKSGNGSAGNSEGNNT